MTNKGGHVQRGVFGLLLAAAIYAGYTTTGHLSGVIARYRAETAWFLVSGVTALFGVFASRPLDGPRPTQVVTLRQTLLLFGVFAAFAFALYAPACSLGLLSDDFTLLSRARRLELWSGPFFRPLPLAIWAILQRVVPSPAPVLHVANVLLHALNATLVTLLASRLGVGRTAALAAGLLFIAFPASVEPVAWASGIQDVLVATLCLGFVLACTTDRTGAGPFLAGLVCLVLALCTKETAVVAPLLAFAVVYGRQDGRWHGGLLIGGAVISAGYGLVRLLATSAGAFATRPSRYLLKELVSRPFGTLALPFTGPELQRFAALAALSVWVFLGALLVAIWRWRDDRSSIGIVARFVVWVLLSVAPVYSMLFVSADLQGSRYMYLAACAWSVMLGTLVVGGSPGPRWITDVGLVMTVLIAVLFIAGVRSHLEDWREAARLRDRVIASAIERLHHSNCDVIYFKDLPDSVRGAYVFRNGFPEAMNEPQQAARTSMAPGPPSCTVRWDGVSLR